MEKERQRWAQEVAALSALYRARNRPERPYSLLAQARCKLAVRERRICRRQKDMERAQRWLERCRQKVADLEAELETLEQRLAWFIEDNRTNPWPICAIFRLDGGFASGPNVALLIEMGYEVESFATNGQVVKAWRRRVTLTTPWTRVGKNAEMVAWEKERIANCPYPLDIALERFHTGDEERYGVLLHYGPEPVTADLRGWFTFYKGHQTIGGCQGGKEHLPDASPEGALARRIGDPGGVRPLRCQLRPLGSRMAPSGLP